MSVCVRVCLSVCLSLSLSQPLRGRPALLPATAQIDAVLSEAREAFKDLDDLSQDALEAKQSVYNQYAQFKGQHGQYVPARSTCTRTQQAMKACIPDSTVSRPFPSP